MSPLVACVHDLGRLQSGIIANCASTWNVVVRRTRRIRQQTKKAHLAVIGADRTGKAEGSGGRSCDLGHRCLLLLHYPRPLWL